MSERVAVGQKGQRSLQKALEDRRPLQQTATEDHRRTLKAAGGHRGSVKTVPEGEKGHIGCQIRNAVEIDGRQIRDTVAEGHGRL